MNIATFINKVNSLAREANTVFRNLDYMNQNQTYNVPEEIMLQFHKDDPIWMDYYNGLKAGYNKDPFNYICIDGKYYFRRRVEISFRLSNNVLAQCNFWNDFTEDDAKMVLQHLKALIKEIAWITNQIITTQLAEKADNFMEDFYAVD